MIFFTICSANFLAYANTLWDSVKKFYPDIAFYAAICDSSEHFDELSLPYPVIALEQLGIPLLDEMKKRYNITELNTSIKPFVFQYLFDRHPGEIVVYLDPDIKVFSRLHELETCFAEGADCVLTPHILRPAEHAEMSDLRFLTYGIYNLGFCALRDTETVRRVASWWGRRLEEYCVIDFSKGLFVDQKWADYLPAFIDNTYVLRHPGYNVAYWNLSERRIALRGGAWEVNGEPLRFFHFSGNRIEDINTFTRHSGQFTVENTLGLKELLDIYRSDIFRNGHSFYSTIPFAFSWSGRSGNNEHTPEHLKRSRIMDVAPHLPLLSSRSFEEFQAQRRNNSASVEGRKKYEEASIPDHKVFYRDGFCHVCGERQQFQVSQMYASGRRSAEGQLIPNWREHLNCMSCGIVNRTRGSLKILDQEFAPSPDSQIYITEQVTPLFEILNRRFANVVGSEFLGPDLDGGFVSDGVRHEDVQTLSFPDLSFDLVLSFDVLEHVPFPQQAFQEIHRCLKPGGRLFFTVPFSWGDRYDVVRARLDETGTIEHLLQPEYHGNPVDMEGGSLCFRYFGWSVIDDLKQAGFRDAEILSYWSKELGHLGDPLFVIVALK